MNGVPVPATIRKATVADYEAVARLNRVVQAWHAEAYPSVFRPASPDTLTAATFEDLLAAPEFTVLVAVAGADVIGYLTARAVERPETAYTYARRVLYIDQIGVDRAARRTGAGRSLVAAALALADERGIGRVPPAQPPAIARPPEGHRDRRSRGAPRARLTDVACSCGGGLPPCPPTDYASARARPRCGCVLRTLTRGLVATYAP